MRIGLIADTHVVLDKAVFTHFDQCDEICHAGDFGTMAVAEELAAFRPLKGVYGNIDGRELRVNFPETAGFTCQGLKVIMRHIGGYPGRYAPGVRALLEKERPGLFIAGHSHILKEIGRASWRERVCQ